jgi:hypothetical protein
MKTKLKKVNCNFLLFLEAYKFNVYHVPFSKMVALPPWLSKPNQLLLTRRHGLRTCTPDLEGTLPQSTTEISSRKQIRNNTIILNLWSHEGIYRNGGNLSSSLLTSALSGGQWSDSSVCSSSHEARSIDILQAPAESSPEHCSALQWTRRR